MDKSDKEILVEIDRYIRGELNAAETDDLWKKFITRPEYYSWFETELHLRNLGEFNNGSGNLPSGKDTQFAGGNHISRRNRSAIFSFLQAPAARRWLLGMAAILVLTFGFSFFLTDDSTGVNEFAIGSIDFSELSGAGIVRSGSETSADPEVALNQGIAFAYSGQERDAVEQFKLVIAQSDDPDLKSRAELNLGIVHYNLSDFTEAEIHLEAALNVDDLEFFFEEKTGWFLANTYLNLEKIDEAITILEEIAGLEGRYESEARDILEKLESIRS